MTEFVDQIRLRVTDALTDLAQARAAGDDYRVQVHTGELESFARLAEERGEDVPDYAGRRPSVCEPGCCPNLRQARPALCGRD